MKQVFIFLFLFLMFSGCQNQIINNHENICYTNETLIIRGSSMEPRLHNGEEVLFLSHFYDCNEIKIDDIVIVNQSGNSNLIIKQVKALPGDSFVYFNNTIYINNNILVNSQNQSYNINSKMIALYANSYPILPENSYLILGDNLGGSFDASKFGLIDKSEIVGKALKNID